jgi:SPX domain protein involved in polyphosphate accumulation
MKAIRVTLISASMFMLMMSFQIIKTQLTITVRNELGNIEEGVKVQLFEREEDYKNETNVAAEAYTDKKGMAKFKELKAISYYVIARKDDKDNSGGGEVTGRLEANRINKTTIVIQ